MHLLKLAAFAGLANAFQLPTWIPFVTTSRDSQATFELPSPESVNRVAVIGAGAGGSSAAFWISKAKERFPDLDIQVDVFEKSDRVGGSE